VTEYWRTRWLPLTIEHIMRTSCNALQRQLPRNSGYDELAFESVQALEVEHWGAKIPVEKLRITLLNPNFGDSTHAIAIASLALKSDLVTFRDVFCSRHEVFRFYTLSGGLVCTLHDASCDVRTVPHRFAVFLQGTWAEAAEYVESTLVRT